MLILNETFGKTCLDKLDKAPREGNTINIK